ncbi:hypothetical protein ACTJJ0_32620 [Chitinophaga sp. 22321]|uniref:Uncharacterized protein n=1 Tax=Chitinophaga hostae TaxID=2831022 RepID=A0ABS5JBF3_9BACT|nr:hypothetical protein [Chitinophaga hostae]MBS0031782.1 hypothetical protein [Chitinophaga hostae]
MKKYGILILVKHSDLYFQQTPEEEAESQLAVNNFISSWQPRIVQTFGYHACGLGEYDWFGLFEVDEIADWEAFREEYHRRFRGRTVKRDVVIGVSHPAFVEATKDIDHYKKLREMNILPGMAEKNNHYGKN